MCRTNLAEWDEIAEGSCISATTARDKLHLGETSCRQCQCASPWQSQFRYPTFQNSTRGTSCYSSRQRTTNPLESSAFDYNCCCCMVCGRPAGNQRRAWSTLDQQYKMRSSVSLFLWSWHCEIERKKIDVPRCGLVSGIFGFSSERDACS